MQRKFKAPGRVLGLRDRIRETIEGITAPLSPRERLIIGVSLFGFLALALAGPALANDSNIGKLFSIASTACTSDEAWLQPENASGQPDVARSSGGENFNPNNSSVGSGLGQLACMGFNKTEADLRIANAAVELSVDTRASAVSDGQADADAPSSAQAANGTLTLEGTDAPDSETSLDTRADPANPNRFSEQEPAASLDGMLLVRVSNDSGKTWTDLHVFKASDLNDQSNRASVALPVIFTKDIGKLAVSVELIGQGGGVQVLLDSVTVTYEVGQPAELAAKLFGEELKTAKVPVLGKEELYFEVSAKSSDEGLLNGIGNKLFGGDEESAAPQVTAEVEILGANKRPINSDEVELEFDRSDINSRFYWRARADMMPASADPGRYKAVLRLTDEQGNSSVIEQDFYWGVLAVNTNRTTLSPGQTTGLNITVLDEFGATVCDSQIMVNIVDANGQPAARLSTADESLRLGEKCEEYGNHIDADYYGEFSLDKTGQYEIVTEATNTNGSFSVRTKINVVKALDIDIMREGPTRLYPVFYYPMKLHVASAMDALFTVVEKVPASFSVRKADFSKPYDRTYQRGGLRYLEWDLELKAGKAETLGYEFDAPNISPEFYVSGPVEIRNGSNTVFEEYGSWQLAGDALGSFAIYKDTAGGDETTTTQVKLTWDTTLSQGTDLSINGGRDDINLEEGGHYLVAYNVAYETSGGSNRSEINTNLDISGSDQAYGRSTCYIRRAGGTDYCWISGSTVVDSTANDTLSIEAQRTDNNSATVQRRANSSGVSVLKLDDSWDYARIREAGGGQAFNSTAFTAISLDTEDELDSSSFSRTGGEITLLEAGHYMVLANAGFNSTTGQRRNIEMRLSLDGTEIEGSRTTAYLRGTNGTQNHATTYSGIIETSSANQVLRLEAACEGEECGNITNDANETGITVVKLPETAEYLRIYESGGGQGVDGTSDPVLFDTNSEVDGNSFAHTVGSAQVTVNEDDDYLFFGSFYSNRVSTTNGNRLYPHWQWRENGSGSVEYGSFGKYNRGDQSTTGTFSSGDSGLAILDDLSDGDTVELINTDESTGSDAQATFIGGRYAMQAVSLSTLIPPPPAETNQIHYRWRDNSTDLNSPGGYLASEDTPVTDIDKLTPIRLRIAVANEGLGEEAQAKTYQLQFAEKTGVADCSNIISWTAIDDSASDAVAMAATPHIDPDGELTSTSLLANGEGYTYANGEGRKNTDTTGAIGPLTQGYHTELEYSIQFTDEAVVATDYCFRVYDTAADLPLDNYDQLPEAEIANTRVLENILGETGSFVSEDNGDWTSVTFQQTYSNPVIIGLANTRDGNPALVFEADNVTSTGADMRLCESDGATANGCGTHGAETAAYMVIDSSVAATMDGIEAGTFNVSGQADTTTVSPTYSETFSSTPYVFANVNTVNDTEFPIQVVIPSTSISGFTAGICDHLQGSVDNCDGSHITETVGWVAIEPGNEPFLKQFETGFQSIDTDQDSWQSIAFSSLFDLKPLVFYSSQEDTGGQDVEHEEARNVSVSGAEIHFCEIDADNTCDNHNADNGAWLAIEEGLLAEQLNLDQDGFRFYQNIDAIQPTTPLGNENEAILNVDDTDVVRLRTAVQDGINDLPAGQFDLTLQYAETSTTCSAAGSWSNVGAAGSGTIWRGFDNGSPVNGATITSSLLDGGTNQLMSYVEQNDSPTIPNGINVGQRGEWDWAIQNNGADPLTQYCFRVVSNGSPIQYTRYARLTTASAEANLDPNSPANLAQEKTTAATLSAGGYTNETSVVFKADVSDQNTADVLRLCVEVQPISVSFSGTETGCGSTVSYNGSALEAEVTLPGLLPKRGYHWQARVEDSIGATSAWVSFGGNGETESDFIIDNQGLATTVFDGNTAGVDIDYNGGGLSSLDANWEDVEASFPSGISGLALWLDGADVNGDGSNPANGASITTWFDKSGLSNDIAGTGAATYDAAEQAVAFSDDVQPFDDNYDRSGGNANSMAVFAVVTGNANTATNHVWFETTTPRNAPAENGLLGGATALSGNNFWSAHITDRAQLATIWDDTSGESTGYLNRIAEYNFTETQSFADSQRLTIGDDTTGGNRLETGEFVHELIVLNQDLSESERIDIQEYLACKWNLDTCADSPLTLYEYAIGTVPGGTDTLDWTSNGTSTSASVSSLSLNTSQPYYFSVRATDEAGNQTVASSDGILISPTLSFSASSTTASFENLTPGNNFTDTESATLTTSTNAYNGYYIRAYATGLLENEQAATIPMFDGGTYALPGEWLGGDTGYGLHSTDTSIGGSNIFNSTPCPGGGNPPCYAPVSTAAPGDIIADHTTPVSGTPIVNEEFTVTHRVTTSDAQAPGTYTTVIIYSVTARY